MNLSRLVMLLLLLLAGALLVPGAAHAQILCTATNPTTLNFGTIKVSTGSGASDNGSVNYNCRNSGTAAISFRLCVAIGTPGSGTSSQPLLRGPGASTLGFNLYSDPLSGNVWDTAHPLSVSLAIAPRSTLTGTIPYYGHIPGNQASAVAGNYRSGFSRTRLGYLVGSSCGAQAGYRFANFMLNVRARLGNACVVSAGPNLNFGSAGGVPAGSPAVSGSDTIVVTCPNRTPYNVGLLPSDGDAGGAGIMKRAGGGADTVQYQLYQGAALSTPWGNTATRASTGNGVHGTGNGTAQSLTVYARTTSSTDVTPDTYTDTVQINVNY